MRKLAIIFFSFGLFVSLSSQAQVVATWDLSRDLQISFTQGANGVWYFMESEALVHDPAVYRLLTRYSARCGFDGLGCWRGIEDHPSICPECVENTLVAFNFTNKVIGANDEQYIRGFKPHTVRLLPSSERFVIVAWQSPVTGTVKVSARFTQRTGPIVDDVAWSVEKGTETLRSGHIGAGYDFLGLARLSNVRVAKDDVLYFVVSNNFAGFGSYFWVDLQVTITQVQ